MQLHVKCIASLVIRLVTLMHIKATYPLVGYMYIQYT